MKKLFRVMLSVYSVLLFSVYLKLLPNPSDFFITRDIILRRREVGFWQFNLIPFASYLSIGHIGLAAVWGVLLALSLKKLSVKKCALFSLIFFVSVEVIQFVTAAGAFDIDTIIQHFIGAVAGSALVLMVLSKKNQAEPKQNTDLMGGTQL